MAFPAWSTTAGSNTAVGGVSIAEGMNPSDVNNAMRAVMADARAELATQDTLAAATTTDLGSKAASTITLTGTAVSITGLGTVSAGIRRRVIANAAHTLTYNASSLIIPGAANYLMADGDVFDAESLGSGNWRVVNIERIGPLIPSGTLMLFQQTAAPTGWTKQTTHNNKALRVVSGTASSGGATAFTTVFGSGKTTGSHTLTAGEIPAHTHDVSGSTGNESQDHAHDYTDYSPTGGIGLFGGGGFDNQGTTRTTATANASHYHTFSATTGNGTGGGGGHTHTLSLDMQYVDLIIAAKD